MQKIIAKYGLAAHLALAAVAPLTLSRFFGDASVATAMLWISASAFGWMLMAPSVLHGERLNGARYRVLRSLAVDPLVWVMVLVMIIAGVRALNGGIRMAYDAEALVWNISSATFPLLPGTVDGCGYLPFATVVMIAVLVAACRHALGKAGRMAFCLISATLAGASAVTELALGLAENQTALPGFAYGVYLLLGTVALSGAFEYRWNRAMPFFVLAIGATGAGLFAYADTLHLVAFLSAEIVLVGYVFFFAHATLRKAAEFKLLVVLGLSLTVGAFAVLSLLSEETVAAKTAAIMTWKPFPDDFFELRSVLSDIALRSWKVHPWLGSGLSSFPLDVRFFATDSDWMVLGTERASALNGYWHLIAERGIAGAAIFALPVLFLLVYFVIGLVRGVMAMRLPHPAAFAGLLALAAAVLEAFFGISFLRPEVMVAVVVSLAVSTKSFPKEKIDG